MEQVGYFASVRERNLDRPVLLKRAQARNGAGKRDLIEKDQTSVALLDPLRDLTKGARADGTKEGR
ncbi:MAG: hypothetical protein QM773_01250 [Hyphomonadaceae bacterium]